MKFGKKHEGVEIHVYAGEDNYYSRTVKMVARCLYFFEGKVMPSDTLILILLPFLFYSAAVATNFPFQISSR